MFKQVEESKRETQRQNMVTAFNIAGSQMSTAFMNPKFLAKAFYTALLGFTAFYCTRISISMVGSFFMGKFGKP